VIVRPLVEEMLPLQVAQLGRLAAGTNRAKVTATIDVVELGLKMRVRMDLERNLLSLDLPGLGWTTLGYRRHLVECHLPHGGTVAAFQVQCPCGRFAGTVYLQRTGELGCLDCTKATYGRGVVSRRLGVAKPRSQLQAGELGRVVTAAMSGHRGARAALEDEGMLPRRTMPSLKKERDLEVRFTVRPLTKSPKLHDHLGEEALPEQYRNSYVKPERLRQLWGRQGEE